MFGKEEGEQYFHDFLKSFNDLSIKVRGGKLVPREARRRFPRALMWYYGTSNLVLDVVKWEDSDWEYSDWESEWDPEWEDTEWEAADWDGTESDADTD